MNIEPILSEINRKYVDCQHCGQDVPAWLQTQVDGIIAMESDCRRGLALILEGMFAEREHLEAVTWN